VVRFARRFVSLAGLVALFARGGSRHVARWYERRSPSRAEPALLPVRPRPLPFTSAKITWDSWRSSDDTKAVKYGYALFAPIWSFSIEAGASVIRGVAGALELLPGLALLAVQGRDEPAL
jgi:hypothetical protein